MVEQDFYEVSVAGLERRLPLVEVAPGLRIAVIDSMGDTELLVAAARILATRLPEGVELLMTAETKGILLAHQLSLETGISYIALRKARKPYMGQCVCVQSTSIGTGKAQELYLTGHNQRALWRKKVALVDDVISTGSTMHALDTAAKQFDAVVTARVCLFTEGDRERWRDVISLGHLPLFS